MGEDFRIWDDLVKGKEYALPKIYNMHVDFLYNYGKKFTKDETFVLDAIHDIFYDVMRNHSNLGATDNVRLYLLKSLRRKLFRLLDKNRRYDSLGNEMEHFIPEITFSIEEQIIKNEESAQKMNWVKEAMKQLNPLQREILYYKFTCGFDYNQICEIMSVSYDSARQTVSRSIQLLRKNIPSDIFVFFTPFFNELNK